MRLHVVGLANTRVEKAWSTCAYSTKTWRFCRMMTELGHEVILYSAGPSDAVCSEHVECLAEELRVKFFGVEGRPDFSDDNGGWVMFNALAALRINERAAPRDLLLVIGGRAHASIAKSVPMPCIEFGIGYEGVFAPYRVFESYAWMHTVYGMQQGAATADGRWFDTVIPNFFDEDDFTPSWESPKENYALYLGRMIDRKGVVLAAQVAEALDMPFIMAGDGDRIPEYGEHIGPVGPARRAELLASASFLICPTLYIEPFGGVAVEAHFSGTPTLTPDFGAFTETVINGVNGYRCRTFDEFLVAGDLAPQLETSPIVASADRYTVATVGPQYEDFLERVIAVNAGGGWYDRDVSRRFRPAIASSRP